MKEDLLVKFKNIFRTKLIFPPIFENIPILGFFSKKLPYPFDFKYLNFLNSFRFFFPKQIHSTNIIELNEQISLNPSLAFFKLKGDAVFTYKKNIFIGIRTADCVPILITTKRGDFIGAVHGGWRGSVNKILLKFLKKIINSGIKPEEILIAIGPHIKVCCYEVGEEVIEKLKTNFENFKSFLVFKNKKIFLDLEKLNYYQALECLIPQKNIWISKDCTYCLKDYYWSYRFYKKRKGFQIGLIGKLK